MQFSNICIIGCGKMGQAILSGWLRALPSDKTSFCVVEHTREKCASIAERFGVNTYLSLEDMAAEEKQTDMFVLAVKPQAIDQVLKPLAAITADITANAQPPLAVSIAAGITTEVLSQALPNARIVRVMPNTPLQVGAGATVVASGAGANTQDAQAVCDMFAQLGMAEIVDESEIDAVCALSGGGPAYTALFIEALTAAGTRRDLSPELSQKLAFQTIYGTCKLMEQTGATAEETREAVCSPGGTTLAALSAMEDSEGGFTKSIDDGIAAAIHRAKELSSC